MEMDREKVIRGIECLLSDEECDLRKCSYGEFSNCINKVLSDALALLKEQEAYIEHLEEMNEKYGYINIVRCKDCKHSKSYQNGTMFGCEFGNGLRDADWFCADGERK